MVRGQVDELWLRVQKVGHVLALFFVGDDGDHGPWRQDGLELDPLHSKGTEVISTIRDEVSNEETRRVFSRTGLDVRSCLTLQERIIAQESRAADAIFNPETSLEEIIGTVLPDIVDLQQMDTGYEFSGDLIELANDWLGQLSMPEIVGQHLAQGADPRKFHRFVADLFGYKLPWGIGAYVAIAEHVLSDDREVSEVVCWLPTMVRYGVRTPSASWAMTLGCPSRDLSVSLAAGFVSDVFDGGAAYRAYSGFVSWFSTLTEEDFTYRFGATPHESEVLSRRSASLVPNNRSLTNALRAKASVLRTAVAGVRYENRAALLTGVVPGSTVRLPRDYSNQYDPNAIEVRTGGELLGFVPRNEARLLAPLIDAGTQTIGTVVEVDRDQSEPQLVVEISIEA